MDKSEFHSGCIHNENVLVSLCIQDYQELIADNEYMSGCTMCMLIQ